MRGKRGVRSEADKLLGDEGVIQMLNRVPSGQSTEVEFSVTVFIDLLNLNDEKYH